MNGVRNSWPMLVPSREGDAFARQSKTGSAFPCTSNGSNCSLAKTVLVARYSSSTATAFTGAAAGGANQEGQQWGNKTLRDRPRSTQVRSRLNLGLGRNFPDRP